MVDGVRGVAAAGRSGITALPLSSRGLFPGLIVGLVVLRKERACGKQSRSVQSAKMLTG